MRRDGKRSEFLYAIVSLLGEACGDDGVPELRGQAMRVAKLIQEVPPTPHRRGSDLDENITKGDANSHVYA